MNSGDVTKKDGDDYAAGIYITFDYPVSDLSFGDRIKYRFYKTFTSFDVPTKGLNYVWANKGRWVLFIPILIPIGYRLLLLNQAMKKPVHGKSKNEISFKIIAKFFGEDSPAITGIQIRTDSDNTEKQPVRLMGESFCERNRTLRL